MQEHQEVIEWTEKYWVVPETLDGETNRNLIVSRLHSKLNYTSSYRAWLVAHGENEVVGTASLTDSPLCRWWKDVTGAEEVRVSDVGIEWRFGKSWNGETGFGWWLTNQARWLLERGHPITAQTALNGIYGR